jgi:hypothetical protein
MDNYELTIFPLHEEEGGVEGLVLVAVGMSSFVERGLGIDGETVDVAFHIGEDIVEEDFRGLGDG